MTRGEFYSAYTPYQAEASQGTLQLLYEYQTMMASLTGLDVSNASLYDGASGLAEACLMAVRANRKSKSQRILLPVALNPTYRDVTQVVAGNQNIAFELLPYDPKGGQTLVSALEHYSGQDITAARAAAAEFLRHARRRRRATDWAHANNALVIGVVNPTSLAVLKPPGQWGKLGADIACGDGQPLGVPLSSGGPYFGFMATRTEHVRQMPGRIIGRTRRPRRQARLHADAAGARAAHPPQQGDVEHLHQPGPAGDGRDDLHVAARARRASRRWRRRRMQRTQQLVDALTRVPGVRLAFDRPRFPRGACCCSIVRSRRCSKRSRVAASSAAADISARYPSLGNALLVCATETRTLADIEPTRRRSPRRCATRRPRPEPRNQSHA